MKRFGIGLVALLGLLTPISAEACRVFIPPEARLINEFTAVAIGTVEAARYTSDPQPDWHSWEAMVRLSEIVEGAPAEPVYRIGRTGSSAACDDGQPLPRDGDTWVVYLREHPAGGLYARESYPLTLAREIDLRFQE